MFSPRHPGESLKSCHLLKQTMIAPHVQDNQLLGFWSSHMELPIYRGASRRLLPLQAPLGSAGQLRREPGHRGGLVGSRRPTHRVAHQLLCCQFSTRLSCKSTKPHPNSINVNYRKRTNKQKNTPISYISMRRKRG